MFAKFSSQMTPIRLFHGLCTRLDVNIWGYTTPWTLFLHIPLQISSSTTLNSSFVSIDSLKQLPNVNTPNTTLSFHQAHVHFLDGELKWLVSNVWLSLCRNTHPPPPKWQIALSEPPPKGGKRSWTKKLLFTLASSRSWRFYLFVSMPDQLFLIKKIMFWMNKEYACTQEFSLASAHGLAYALPTHE
jgi:hypothetical protein